MTNLDAAIRAKLDRQRDVMTLDDMFVSDITGTWQDALLAVLDLHKRNESGDCTECLTGVPDYEAEGHVQYPCPTVQVLTGKLEIEA